MKNRKFITQHLFDIFYGKRMPTVRVYLLTIGLLALLMIRVEASTADNRRQTTPEVGWSTYLCLAELMRSLADLCRLRGVLDKVWPGFTIEVYRLMVLLIGR